jgi:hypothetical protein
MPSDYFVEQRQINADLQRIASMITACRDAENSLRLLHDERRSRGGGSRAYMADLLSAAGSRTQIVVEGIRHFALDLPVRSS